MEYKVTQFDTILLYSVGAYLNESGQVVYEWSEEGPVYGPNGELELDPDNQQCGGRKRPVFATCKNNCPGGKLFVIALEICIVLFSVNFPVVTGEAV